MQLDANVLIFDPDLTPIQAHAIADFTDLKVIDRTMLILDIFAQRAKSRDGKLQVELAQLRYRLPRLHEKNTMMSRLTGGIGGRGPGETKLEENRRRARERIHRLEKEIDRFGEQRAGRRAERVRRGLPIVAIVGYTNAGQVDAAQHAHPQRRAGGGPAVRDAGSDDAAAAAAARARDHHRRHRRVHPRSAARSGARVPRDARRAGRGRPAAARGRRRRSGERAADRGRRGDPGGPGAGGDAPDPGDEQGRPAAPTTSARACARGGGDLPVVAISARDGATTAALLEAVEAALASEGFAEAAPSRPRRWPRPDPTPRACRHEAALSVLGTAAAVVILLGRADPRARARALRVRPAVRREGAALLARVRAAHLRHHLRRDRIPAVGASRWAATCACSARIPAIRSRPRTGRARWPRSRSGSATASSSPGRCSICCWRCFIYFVHFAGQRTMLPPTIGTVLPNLPAANAGLLPGDRVESVDGQRIRYWEELDTGHRDVGREDVALRDPARPRRRGARRDADRDRTVGTAAPQGAHAAGSA